MVEKFRIRPDPDPYTAADRFVFKSYPLTGRRIWPNVPPEKEWKHMIQEYGKSDTSEVHENTKKR